MSRSIGARLKLSLALQGVRIQPVRRFRRGYERVPFPLALAEPFVWTGEDTLRRTAGRLTRRTSKSEVWRGRIRQGREENNHWEKGRVQKEMVR
jgi:hypothetical protein